jgi:hypothetical protein
MLGTVVAGLVVVPAFPRLLVEIPDPFDNLGQARVVVVVVVFVTVSAMVTVTIMVTVRVMITIMVTVMIAFVSVIVLAIVVGAMLRQVVVRRPQSF